MNTTVAPQALALLNDPFVRLRAEELAKRVQAEAVDEGDSQVRLAFQLCLNRDPEPGELADVRDFITQQCATRTQRDAASAQRVALTDLCQSLFALNEFIYVD